MKHLLLVLLLSPFALFSQSVSSVDFVKIKNNLKDEALYYYENNWKIHRSKAKERGHILSYKMLLTQNNPNGNFDLILITEYPNKEVYETRETIFKSIIDNRPGGIRLLNAIEPEEFREVIFSNVTRTIISDK